MYYKQVELQKMFGVGQTYTGRVCRLIDNHPERYGRYAALNKRYSDTAFADALKYRKQLESGEEIPMYDMSEHVYTTSDDIEDAIQAGARKMRNAIFEQVDQYFEDTQFPKEARDVKKAIRLAMLAIVCTAEI